MLLSNSQAGPGRNISRPRITKTFSQLCTSITADEGCSHSAAPSYNLVVNGIGCNKREMAFTDRPSESDLPEKEAGKGKLVGPNEPVILFAKSHGLISHISPRSASRLMAALLLIVLASRSGCFPALSFLCIETISDPLSLVNPRRPLRNKKFSSLVRV